MNLKMCIDLVLQLIFKPSTTINLGFFPSFDCVSILVHLKIYIYLVHLTINHHKCLGCFKLVLQYYYAGWETLKRNSFDEMNVKHEELITFMFQHYSKTSYKLQLLNLICTRYKQPAAIAFSN